jgi:hypothetical protein
VKPANHVCVNDVGSVVGNDDSKPVASTILFARSRRSSSHCRDEVTVILGNDRELGVNRKCENIGLVVRIIREANVAQAYGTREDSG